MVVGEVGGLTGRESARWRRVEKTSSMGRWDQSEGLSSSDEEGRSESFERESVMDEAEVEAGDTMTYELEERESFPL